MRLLYGGDPCPVCGIELDYDEIGSEREPVLIHPDPQCGWLPVSYPARIEDASPSPAEDDGHE